MLNTAQLNTSLLNSGPLLTPIYGGEAVRSVEKWSYEVRSKSGNLYGYLTGCYNGEYTAKRNQAHDLRFTYPAENEYASYLTTANQIWLRDDTGALVQKFHMKRVEPVRNGVRTEIEVSGQSIGVQLFSEWVTNYSATATVKTHLKAWLDAQSGSLPIRLGFVSSTYAAQSLTFNFDDIRTRDAINQLYETIGEGDMWIDPSTRRLNWKTRSGDNKGQRIVYGVNARGIRKIEDDSEQFTRLYLYGDGNGAERITLVDAGEANEYIQQDTGTYGVITEKRVMKEIKTPATLLAVAQTLLDQYSTPTICYEVDAIDYSNSNDGPDFSFERLRMGSRVLVIDDGLGIEVYCTVVEIRYNLDRPLDTRVTLENKPKDLRFVIRDLIERVETLELTPIDMATAEPPAVGTGTVGTSDRPARENHTHDIDPTALADLIENNGTVSDAVEAAVTGSGLAGTDIQPIGTANSPGDNSAFALDDHVHKGFNYTAADFASLPSEAVSCIAVTTGSLKYAYVRIDSSTWQRFSHI